MVNREDVQVVVDLKVLDSIVYAMTRNISKSHLAKVFSRVGESNCIFWRKILRKIKYVLLYECSFAS